MKTFLIHSEKLTERNENLQHICKNLKNFDVEIISQHETETLTSNQLNKINTEILTLENSARIYKHIHCYETILENEIDVALILEDDVILSNSFNNQLERCLNELCEVSWDICYLSTNDNIHINKSSISSSNKTIFRRGNYPDTICKFGSVRSVTGYLITYNGALKIMNHINMESFKFSTGLQDALSIIAKFRLINSYWIEPVLCENGSNIGKYRSIQHDLQRQKNLNIIQENKERLNIAKEKYNKYSIKPQNNNTVQSKPEIKTVQPVSRIKNNKNNKNNLQSLKQASTLTSIKKGKFNMLSFS